MVWNDHGFMTGVITWTKNRAAAAVAGYRRLPDRRASAVLRRWLLAVFCRSRC